MTNMHEQFPPDDQRLLDLLVDGELADDRRRELLARLDVLPNGWRRCALAFLEAQGWRRNLRGVTREPTTSRTQADNIVSLRPNGRPHSHWIGTVLAMAASFLAAFALALTWRGGIPGQPGAPAGVDVAASQPPRASDRSVTDVPPATVEPGQPAADVQMVTLSIDGPEGPQRIEVPVIAADRFDPAWFRGQPNAVPADVVRALRRSGHRVDQHRNLVPVQMRDGSRLVLPVDQVDVRYVGDPYQ